MSDKLKLAQLLWDLNILNVEAARYLCVSERTIYRWLSGKSKVPQSALRFLELLVEHKPPKNPVAAPETVS